MRPVTSLPPPTPVVTWLFSSLLTVTMSSLLSYVDWSQPSLWYSILSITFNPLAWNIVARNGETHSQRFFQASSTTDKLVQSTETGQ